MTQSPEYPDLKWVPPRSWTNANRKSVQLIVIHTTEGSSHAQSAEDGAAYDARRPDGTSTHYFHDNTSTIQCVRTEDQAHTARSNGNRRGIQHELCGRASWSEATWLNAYGTAMLRRAARQAARDARKWGIPVRHLTVAQVRAGDKGFCSHWDITRAFPEDKGSHTDPGPNFPWTVFLNMVRDELNGDDDDMNAAEMTAWARSAEGKKAIQDAVVTADANHDKDAAYSLGGAAVDASNRTKALLVAVQSLATAVAGLSSKVDVSPDEAKTIAGAVVATLAAGDADELVDAIRRGTTAEQRAALAAQITA